MTQGLPEALSEAGLSAVESDYSGSGFHHRYMSSKTSLRPMAEAFKSHGYFLEMLTCEDRREDLQAMRLSYAFNVFGPSERHLVQCDVPAGEHAPSLCDVYRAADWNEREVFDMYGVVFDGHPSLTRILLPDDADFHALLKDFGQIDAEDGEAV